MLWHFEIYIYLFSFAFLCNIFLNIICIFIPNLLEIHANFYFYFLLFSRHFCFLKEENFTEKYFRFQSYFFRSKIQIQMIILLPFCFPLAQLIFLVQLLNKRAISQICSLCIVLFIYSIFLLLESKSSMLHII